MPLCRYFQQGFCKFGQNCRFEHAMPQYGGSHVSPLLRQITQPPPNVTLPRNAPASNPFRTNKKDARELHNMIVKDIHEAEKCGMWPLSSYNFCPQISQSNVPGLEDLSPEEMRYLQMQAVAQGSPEVFVQEIQKRYQQARERLNSLKQPSSETISLIESLTRGPAAAQTPSQFSFASGTNVAQDSWPSSSKPPQPSIFGGASTLSSSAGHPQPSIFGGSSSTSSGFGSSAVPLFAAATPHPSVFGGTSQYGAPATTPNSSIFGGAGAPTQPPLFAGSASQTQQSAFAAPPSIFGGAVQSPFSPPSQSSIFAAAAAAQPQQSSPFGGAPSSSLSGGNIFGGSSLIQAASPPSSFSFALPNAFGSGNNAADAQTAAPSPFGAIPVPANNTTNIFGGIPAQDNVKPGGSIFGGFSTSQSNQSPVAPVNNSVANSNTYSALGELTDTEKTEFEAETFTLGKIPLRPPPIELC